MQFLLVSAHIPMMKGPLPIILCNNSNYHKPMDGGLEISRILEIELGVALFFGLSAQVNNLDQTLKRMLNDNLLVLFLFYFLRKYFLRKYAFLTTIFDCFEYRLRMPILYEQSKMFISPASYVRTAS